MVGEEGIESLKVAPLRYGRLRRPLLATLEMIAVRPWVTPAFLNAYCTISKKMQLAPCYIFKKTMFNGGLRLDLPCFNGCCVTKRANNVTY